MLRKLVIAGVLCLSTIVSATEVDEAQLSLEEYLRMKGSKKAFIKPNSTKGFSLSLTLDDRKISFSDMEKLKPSSLANGCLDKLCLKLSIKEFTGDLAHKRFSAFSMMLKQGGALVMDALWEPRDLESVRERLEEKRKELSEKSEVSKTVEELLKLSPEGLITSLRKTKDLNPFKQYLPTAEFKKLPEGLEFPTWVILAQYKQQLTTFFDSVGFTGLIIDTENKKFIVKRAYKSV